MIRSYNPMNIQCGTLPQDYGTDKCRTLLNDLPAEVAPARTWGPAGQTGVDMALPYMWQLTRKDTLFPTFPQAPLLLGKKRIGKIPSKV